MTSRITAAEVINKLCVAIIASKETGWLPSPQRPYDGQVSNDAVRGFRHTHAPLSQNGLRGCVTSSAQPCGEITEEGDRTGLHPNLPSGHG